MNDSQLKSFIMVADCGSFSKAEEKTYLSKQALIKQVDALETELGFRLFNRGKRGVSLSQAGDEFYKGAKKLLGMWDSITEKCRELAEHRQLIRIANPPHTRLMLADVISEYARRYPEVHQELMLRNGSQMLEDILNGKLDVGEHALTDEVRREELAYTKVATRRYYCLMTDNHPLAGKKEIQPEDLAGVTVGVMRENQKEIISALRHRCAEIDIRTQGTDEAHTVAIYNICFNGGVYITKDYYANSLQPLLAIPLAAEVLRESVIVYRRDPEGPVQRFIALVQELNGEKESV